MKRICAWCGAPLDGSAAPGSPRAVTTTHGICDTCHSRLSTSDGVPIQAFIDRLDVPVVVVDRDMVVRSANSRATAMIGMSVDHTPARIGVVFECASASLPGGCGRSIHCSGCAIRESVEFTHRTGSARRVPATLRRRELTERQDVELYVTTAKVGPNVVLRIDEAVEPEP